MPQLGEIVGEGTVAKELKAVGDAVTSGEPLFEVSTDKVDSEIPAPFSGILTSVVVPEGSIVYVGVILAVIEGADDGYDRGSPASTEDASSSPAPASPASSSDDSRQRSQLSAVVRKLLEQCQLDSAESSNYRRQLLRRRKPRNHSVATASIANSTPTNTM
jgi:2-oxoglutarate dehydrogenase E2 component (dihydrolipoamide succinyltransferase)